jgi:hypothetical protein
VWPLLILHRNLSLRAVGLQTHRAKNAAAGSETGMRGGYGDPPHKVAL